MTYYKGEMIMFDKINFMNDTHVFVGLKEGVELKTNLLSAHVVISDSEKHILGEIVEINDTQAKMRLLGEFENGRLRNGVIRKPLLDAQVRTILEEEIPFDLKKYNVELGEFYSDGLRFSSSTRFS